MAHPDACGGPLRPSPIQTSVLDTILTRQIVIAWAGERGDREEPDCQRLGWWKTDLVSEFGGRDLFAELLPQTWAWAMVQAVREAARRIDARRRAQGHDPDQMITMFSLGFELDERLDERLRDLKGSGRTPTEALPGLRALLPADWSEDEALLAEWRPQDFPDWIVEHGSIEHVNEPAGRRLRGAPPEDPGLLTARLVAALAPVASPDYPMPHYRRTTG